MRPTPVTPRSIGLLLGLGLGLATRTALADPQVSVGVTAGVAGEGLGNKVWAASSFHLGLRGEVFFARNKDTDFGVGPYVEVLSNGFNEIQFGGGLSGLFPVLASFPLELSLGAYGRKAIDPSPLSLPLPLQPGIAAELFFGSHGYNFHGNYEMAAGLVVHMRYGLGPSHETSIIVGALIDVEIFARPVLFLVNAARGGSHATDPVTPPAQAAP